MAAEDLDRMAAPHVARAWFLELDLPSGIARFHNGTGRKIVAGHEWRGVTDPIGGQLVALSNVEEPRFGQAVAVQVTLSGANRAFFKSVHDAGRGLEGRRAYLYFGMFDGETQELLYRENGEPCFYQLFPGRMSAPSLMWAGIGIRTVSLTIESIWSSQNYPFGGKWNDADQQRRYPGDKGLQFVGVKVSENWQ